MTRPRTTLPAVEEPRLFPDPPSCTARGCQAGHMRARFGVGNTVAYP